MINDHFDQRANMTFSVPDYYSPNIEKDPFYLKYYEDTDDWSIIYKDHPSIFKNIPVLRITTDGNNININTTNIMMCDEVKITLKSNAHILDIGSEWCIGTTKSEEDIHILRLYYYTDATYVYFADIEVDFSKALFYITVFGKHIECFVKSSYHQSMFETEHFSLEIAL